MAKEKVLNLLGLAMRAGKLVTGEELTIGDIRSNKAKFVFVAGDASENTRKKSRTNVLIITFLAVSRFYIQN